MKISYVISLLAAVFLFSCSDKSFYALPAAVPSKLNLEEHPRLYPYRIDKKYGLLDANGNIKVEAQFDSLANADAYSDPQGDFPFYVGIKSEYVISDSQSEYPEQTKSESFFIDRNGNVTKIGDFQTYVMDDENAANAFICYISESGSGAAGYVAKATGEFHVMDTKAFGKNIFSSRTDDRLIFSSDFLNDDAGYYIYDYNGAEIFSLDKSAANHVEASPDGNYFVARKFSGENGVTGKASVYTKDGELILECDETPPPKVFGDAIVCSLEGVLNFYDAGSKTNIASFPYAEKFPDDDIINTSSNDGVLTFNATRIIQNVTPEGYYDNKLSDKQRFVLFDANGKILYEKEAATVISMEDEGKNYYLVTYPDKKAEVLDENFNVLHELPLTGAGWGSGWNLDYSAGELYLIREDGSGSIVDWKNSTAENLKTAYDFPSYLQYYKRVTVYAEPANVGNKYLYGLFDNETNGVVLEPKYKSIDYYDDNMIYVTTAYYGAYVDRSGQIKYVQPFFDYDGE